MSNLYLKILFLSVCFICTAANASAQTPKFVAECTITYSVFISGSNKQEETIKKLYIKGKKTRTEISNAQLFQAVIFDNKTGEATVLKEVGGDKYISMFTSEKWKEKNKRWDSSTLSLTNENKKILTYNCRKAIITMKDGNKYVVYFTTDFTASATENPYQFRNIPGLILEYDSQTEKGNNIEFKAVDINFSPVPAAKFAIPTSGYRLL